MWKQFKGFLFHLFPHHLVSRITFWFTRFESSIKNPTIKIFIRAFDVDMSEAVYENPEDYKSFNDFFTRKLVASARPINQAPSVITSPADGRISQLGSYANNHVIQAKGQFFSISQLLGTSHRYGNLCEQGNFATIYLSPKNYHRVHMPFSGRLVEMTYIPGRLFSVAPYSAEVIKGLYCRNERVASIFETDIGFMAVVMVGAVNVSAISMTWEGLVTPTKHKSIYSKRYDGPIYNKGDEIGIFNMGSTAIIAFESNQIQWAQTLQLQQIIKMGQDLGTIIPAQN